MPLRFPLFAELIQFGRRIVETGRVVVQKTVTIDDVVVDLPPLERRVPDVQRVAIGRTVERPQPVRTEGDVTIVPLHEERWVLEKRLFVREELHIRVRVTHEPLPPQRVALRREDVQVRSTSSRARVERSDDR